MSLSVRACLAGRALLLLAREMCTTTAGWITDGAQHAAARLSNTQRPKTASSNSLMTRAIQVRGDAARRPSKSVAVTGTQQSVEVEGQVDR